MKARSTGAGLALLGAVAVWLAGCRADVRVAPPSPPPATPAPAVTDATVTLTGYTVQVGAFSVLSNARRLAETLSDIGLDAYYFPHGSGLYRVRFGDFPSRGAAVREAEGLLARKLVEDYFIVAPGAHSAYRPSVPGEGLREKLASTAASFIGVEYAWGGTTRREGVDCSGLVRAVYQLNGLSLPRSAADQFRAGATVSRRRLQKGDLVFFSGSPGRSISHVGIYVGENAFIHAPGQGKRVRVESLENRYFRERFSGARAYLN